MEVFITYRRAADFPDTQNGAPQDMSLSAFDQVLTFLTANTTTLCHVVGNEPCLHPQFVEILEALQAGTMRMVVETTGLMPDDAAAALVRCQSGVAWRLYHPDLYPSGTWDTMARRCAELAKALGDRMLLTLVVHDPLASFDFAQTFIERIGFSTVTLRLPLPADLNALRALAPWLGEFSLRNAKQGRRIIPECGLHPCSLPDAVYGRLMKLGQLPRLCEPQPGVLPDLRLYHCQALSHEASITLDRFTDIGQVFSYLYSLYDELQAWHVLDTPCSGCLMRGARNCMGHCMAGMELDFEKAVTKARADPNLPTEPMALLKRGLLHRRLGELETAEACLRSARHEEPSNGAIHLALAEVLTKRGQWQEADEEYEKAARLSPYRRLVLLRWSALHEARGDQVRAIDLLAEACVCGEQDPALEQRLRMLQQAMDSNAMPGSKDRP